MTQFTSGSIRWFGRKHPAPIYDECPQIPVLVDTFCRHCEEAIEENDDGFLDAGDSVFHRECFLRMILGSIPHQMEMCKCFHPDAGDPQGSTLSKREEAKAAVAYHEKTVISGQGSGIRVAVELWEPAGDE